MSNLSTLLPAGASGKTIDATASGAIATKKPVILNSAGTVTEVAMSGVGFGTPVDINTTTGAGYTTTVFDPDNNKVVIAWNTGGPGGKAAVGTVSGTGISFGSEVAFTSNNCTYLSASYDSNSDKVVLIYRDASNSDYGTAVVGTVSGTSISFGTPVVFITTANMTEPVSTFDSTNNKIVVTYRISGGIGYGRVGTVSGTSISFGSATQMDSSDVPTWPSIAFDANAGKVVIIYRDASASDAGTAVVGTVSGTAISFGTPVVYASNNANYGSATYDSTAQKIVFAYSEYGGNTNYGMSRVVTISGTTPSLGTATTFESAAVTYKSITYSSTLNKVIVAYTDSGNSTYGTSVIGTVSGTSISFTDPVVFESATTTYFSSAYDSNAGRAVIGFVSETGGNSYPTAVVYDVPSGNLTTDNFLGLADAAIANSASGTIVLRGGTVTDVPALPASFDAGVFNAARVDHVSIAFDSNSNKVVVVYAYAASSFNGYAVVGTVSGSSISFGTPERFYGGGTADQTSCAFDSNSNKVVIAYRDNDNSYRGAAVIGTVSGTAITFGDPVVFHSAGWANFMSCTFDSNSNKAVIAYQDYQGASPNYQGHAIVGTVSGTSISFGTAVIFNASSASEAFGATFDSNSNKVVIGYSDGGNSYQGTAIVGTVSGTSISFGSEVVFAAASTDRIGATFDSNSNKVVFGYRDKGNSNYGTAIVGTVSGTSISFGTEVVSESAAIDVGANGQNSPTFDSNSNKAVFAYIDVDNSNYGTVIEGTVSGTAISFGSPTVFNTDTTTYVCATFDSDSNKAVIAYGADAGTGDSGKFGKGGVFDAAPTLTIGSDYYVQAGGTLATSASSPSVKAGKAISTTSLLLTGES